MSDEERRGVTAFVPGHITAFFSAHRTDDRDTTGSRGAGVTLSNGVEVTVDPTSDRRVTLDGRRVDVAPVDGVLDELGVEAAVEATTTLPIGAGFGVSGAFALGTALAANAAAACTHTENELVSVAHRAEVAAGTGLGDVVAQARGGVPVRLEPGAPGHGALDGIPARSRVEYVTFGDLSTETVLSGDTTRLSRAGERALGGLLDEPTLPRLMAESRRFAADAGLLTERVADAVAAVSEVGGEASMAMLGETVFALGTGLTDAGYDPEVCHTYPAGASLVDLAE
jgi:pantoate kinase